MFCENSNLKVFEHSVEFNKMIELAQNNEKESNL